MVASDNKFDSSWVREWWGLIVHEAIICGVQLVSFNHDGDSRCRKGDYYLNLHHDCVRIHILNSDGDPHPFMYLSIGEIHGVPLLGGQDYFHVGMRLRRHLLDLKRRMALSRLGLARGDHLKGCKFLFRNDLLFSDKQNWNGVIRMFSDDVVDWTATAAETDPRKKSTHAYLNFGKRLLRMVTGDTHQLAGKSELEISVLRRQGVEDAAFCLVFVLLWRHWLQKHANSMERPEEIEAPYSVNANFMTRETFLDVILMCQCRILLVKLYRGHFSKFRVHADRFSSR